MPFVGEKGCAVCRLAENLVNFNISYEFNDKRNMPSVHSTRKKLNPPPSQTAKVQVLAIQGQAGSDESSSYEQRILDRIKKCLQRAEHANTPESEAQAAWRKASRLMAQYNVTQADLLDQTTNNDDYAALGGQSVVDITSTKGGEANVISQTWVLEIVSAITTLFDCRSYSTHRRTSIEWTFYGISANTVGAAMAFEMAHNLTLEWARSKTGKNARHSYCLGVGGGLLKIARKEKSEEAKHSDGPGGRGEQSQREERSPHAAEVSHPGQNATSYTLLNARLSPCRENDDELAIKLDDSDNDSYDTAREQGNITDDGDFQDQTSVSDEAEAEAEVTSKEQEEEPLDLDTDFEEQLHRMAPRHVPEILTNVVDHDREGQLTVNPWNSWQALVRFRQSAEKVATEYLKAQNRKLHKGRRREYTIRNKGAYRDGVEDSKKIDVKRRRIQGA